MNNLILFLLLLIQGSCLHKSKQETVADDFESLMGKGLAAWEHIGTQEDFENLAFFKQVFESNLPRLSRCSESHVPKVIHFIWIGPKPFPLESVDNVRSWIAKHPDWTIQFWTDRKRPLPHPKMQMRLLQDFTFLELKDCFHKSDNYGEQSDLLRYEILYQEGGVYVDHDVRCIKPFDGLHSAYDFYCGLEMPRKTALSSSVLLTNNIVGARKSHPLLRHMMQWLKTNWDQIESDYPGKDRDAVINRVSHRTFLVLGECFKKFGGKEGFCDMVFPAFYFNAPEDSKALFARHLYAGSWFEHETAFEKVVRERLMYLSKKANRLILFVSLLSILNLLGFVALFVWARNILVRSRS